MLSLTYVHRFPRYICYCTLNRLQYSVNVTFICLGILKIYVIRFIAVIWNRAWNISEVHTYACIQIGGGQTEVCLQRYTVV
jgi:hypothetical protein